MHELTTQAHAIAGRNFSLDSPKQLQALLFDELKLPAVLKTPKGQPSTNEEALEAIAEAHELPRLILDYRGITKLRSTYVEALPEMINRRTGRVHYQLSARPPPPLAGCPPPIRIFRTFPSAPTSGGASARSSSPRKAGSCSPRTIRR